MEKEEYKFTIAGKIIKYLEEKGYRLTGGRYIGFTYHYKKNRKIMFDIIARLCEEYKIIKRIK